MDSWFGLSFSPLAWFCGIAGLEEGKNQRGKYLRLIQIRSATLSVRKSRKPVKRFGVPLGS
jgi:hypothetical protein